MAKANPSQEPSMEEILASIRRIISDDGGSAPAAVPAAPAAAKPAPVPAAPVDEMPTHMSEDDLDKLFAQADEPAEDEATAEELLDDEVMDLDDPIAEEPLDLVEGLKPDEADVQFVDPQPEPEPDPEPTFDEPEFEPEPPPPPPPRPKATVRPEPRPAPPPEPEEPLISESAGASVNAAFGSLTHTILAQNAKTLDDLVKEMLRPMLKAWLDENLPAIVERLVRAEIERVSRGR